MEPFSKYLPYRNKGKGESIESLYQKWQLDEGLVLAKDRKKRDGKVGKQFWFFESPRAAWDYIQSCKPQDRVFYETIDGRRKMYYDIDCYIPDNKFLSPEDNSENYKKSKERIDELIQELITKTIKTMELHYIKAPSRSNVIVCESHRRSKLSYHIIFGGISMEPDDCKEIFDIVMKDFPQLEVDRAVYNNLQEFRCLGCRKLEWEDPHLQKRIVGKEEMTYEDFRSTLLKPEPSAIKIRRNNDAEKTEKKGKKYEKEEIHEDMLGSNLEEALSHEIMDQFKMEERKDNLIPLKRKKAGYCPLCEKEHTNDNAYLIETKGGIIFQCHRYKSHYSKMEGKEDRMLRLTTTSNAPFDLPSG